MPNKFKLSVKARSDIKKLFRYSFQQFGEIQAVKYKSGLEDCFQLLADNPDMGRKCDDIQEGYFRHEHKSHIIFYRQRPNNIFIATIIHDKMDIKKIFDTGGWQAVALGFLHIEVFEKSFWKNSDNAYKDH